MTIILLTVLNIYYGFFLSMQRLLIIDKSP